MRFFASVLVVLALLVLNCSSSKEMTQEKPRLNTSLKIPEFVLNPEVSKLENGEKSLKGSGNCAVYENEADPNLAITAADQRARADILRQVSNKMNAEFRDYAGRQGNINPQLDNALKSGIITESKLDLPGIEIMKREYLGGVIYSNARWSTSAEHVRYAIESAQKAMQNEEATRSLYNAQQMWDKMEKDIKEGNVQ